VTVTDWHASYLTDPRTMAAARERAMRTGEDGWAAAYTLALTMPPAPGSLQAGWARDVLVPDTLPDDDELVRLERATPADDEAPSGYYSEPNIGLDNPDMPASMVRRARPDETIRPDLRCPACCASAGEPEEVGMAYQAYRCPACSQSWEYTSPDVDNDDDHSSSCGGTCEYCRVQSYIVIMPPAVRRNMAHFRARHGFREPCEASPSVGPDWAWAVDPAQLETPVQRNEAHRSEAEIARGLQATRAMIAEAFGIPEEMLGDTTRRGAASTLVFVDEAPQVFSPMRRIVEDGMMALRRTVLGWMPTASPAEIAAQEVRDTDDLRNALEFASRNPTSQRADQHAGMAAARRQRLVIDLPSPRPGRWSGQTQRVYLTVKGKATLLRLCRPRATR
jgi:hypothetical protein